MSLLDNAAFSAYIADETTKDFSNFLCMLQADFEILVNLIGPIIMKQDTNFRQAISVKERLALT